MDGSAPPRLVALAGTLCAPAIFGPLAAGVTDLGLIDAVSWMTDGPTFDVPSIAARVVERIRAAGGGRVVLLGHSTGGAIAQQVALESPELVEALVLIDTGPNMRGHGDVDAIIARMERDWGRGLFAAVLDRSFATPLEPEAREGFLAYADGVEARAAIEVLRSQRDLDLLPRLGELTVPTAVIHGTEDPTRTVDQARAFAAAIPGATLHLLPSGHSPMFELPDEVAAIVRGLTPRR